MPAWHGCQILHQQRTPQAQRGKTGLTWLDMTQQCWQWVQQNPLVHGLQLWRDLLCIASQKRWRWVRLVMCHAEPDRLSNSRKHHLSFFLTPCYMVGQAVSTADVVSNFLQSLRWGTKLLCGCLIMGVFWNTSALLCFTHLRHCSCFFLFHKVAWVLTRAIHVLQLVGHALWQLCCQVCH